MPRLPALWRDPRLPARYWDKVRIDYGGKRTRGSVCWLWTADLSGKGYGIYWRSKGSRKAHRVIYETLIGPVPPYKPGGPEVDHRCKIRHCVNPRHLVVRVTKRKHQEVTHPSVAAIAEGICLRGHVIPAGSTGRCRECHHEYEHANEALIRRARALLGLSRRAYVAEYGRSNAVAQAIIDSYAV